MARIKPLTVGQLIEQLKVYDPDTLVYTSGDPEGNDFNDVHEVASIPATDRMGLKTEVACIWPLQQYDGFGISEDESSQLKETLDQHKD